MASCYFVVDAPDGRTVPLHAPDQTMKFFDRESAELMLQYIRRLGHAMKEFAVTERSGARARRVA